MKETFSEMTELGLRLHSCLLKAIGDAAKDYDKKKRNWDNHIRKISDEDMESFDADAAEESYSELVDKVELKLALDSLPTELKEVIELYYFDGLKNAEITKLVGISEVTLIKRKTEAINMIRERLNSV